MKEQAVLHTSAGHKLLLEPVVRDELRGVHQDSPDEVGPEPAEELADALFADDTEKTVEAVAVVEPVGRSLSSVGRHPDKDDVYGR